MRSMSWGPGTLSPVLVILLVVGGCQANFGEWPEDAGGVDPCEGVSCGAHGSCHVLDDEPTCVCETAYDGDECDRCYAGYHDEDGECTLDHECLPTSCAGHGECNDEGGEVTCECDTGFNAETHCAECAETYHRNGETCVENESCGDMECEHGSCAEEDGVARCECSRGYSGEHCSDCADGFSRNDEECVLEESCGDRECSGHGTCQERDGGAWCECEEEYDGHDCSRCADGYHRDGESCVVSVPCDETTCPEHYECIDEEDGSTSCVCSEGYGGEDCSLCLEGFHHEDDDCVRNTSCGDIVCVHGSCEEFADGSSRCVCHTGYVSDDCSDCADGYHEGVDDRCEPNETCDDFPCPEHATCTVLGGVASCMCDPGYEGEGCDTCSVGYNDHGDGECVPAYCGDGITDPGEDCDDGNEINTDACLSTCREANCGDGFVCSAEDCDPVERCDDGDDDGEDPWDDGCAEDCLDGERVIETFAGGGVCDELPARAASLTGGGIGVASDGFIYFADSYHHRIRMIRTDGTVTTVAGTGVPGDNGDQLGTKTQIHYPSDVALGPDEDVYFSDSHNGKIRRVVPGDRVHTVLGTGACSIPRKRLTSAADTRVCAPLGIDVGLDGELLYVDQIANMVLKLRTDGMVERVAGTGVYASTPGGSPDGSVAHESPLAGPWDATWLDSGEIVITETEVSKVRLVDRAGRLQTAADVLFPHLIAQDDGRLLVTHSARAKNDAISRITTASGHVELVAGGGDEEVGDDVLATDAHFVYGTFGLAVDERNRIVFDYFYLIIRFSIGRELELLAGNGWRNYCGDVGSADEYEHPEGGEWDYSATNAALDQPYRVVLLEDGTLVWTEAGNHVVRMRLPDGTIDTLAGDGTAGYEDPDGAPRFNFPLGIADDRAGGVVITEYSGNRLRRIDMATREVTTLAGTGAVGRAGDGTPALEAPLYAPSDVAIADDGTIYVADHGNNRILRISGGVVQNYAGSPEGVIGDTGDEGWATAATLNGPMAIDLAEDGTLYLTQYAGTTGHRVRRVDTDSPPRIHAFAGHPTSLDYDEDERDPLIAGMRAPDDVIVSRDSVYIVDSSHNVVRVVRNEGGIQTIRTVAGNGASDFGGDSGLASNASLNGPLGVAVDDHGGLYIADSDNNRIRHAYFPEAH